MSTDNMNITPVETVVTVDRYYKVTGVPAMVVQFRSLSIVPDSVTVNFVNGEFSRMTITGCRVRADGTAGATRHDERFWHADQVPDWAQPLLNKGF